MVDRAPRTDGETVIGRLVAAMEDALRYCDDSGANLPELLSAALTDIARRHGPERLVEHRPGSWEAEHVRRLDLSPLYSNIDRDTSS